MQGAVSLEAGLGVPLRVVEPPDCKPQRVIYSFYFSENQKKKSLSLNICHVKSVESSLGYPIYSRHADVRGRIPEPGHLWGQLVVLLRPPAGKVTALQSALRCLGLLTRGL